MTSDYRKNSDIIIEEIKKKIDEYGLCIMDMDSVRSHLGRKFKKNSGWKIFSNLKIVMEGNNIIVGQKGLKCHNSEEKYMTFRNKGKHEQYIWELGGFVSREESKEYLKEDKKCRKIKDMAKKCREKDPNSLFNNRKLINEIFTGCEIDNDEEN